MDYDFWQHELSKYRPFWAVRPLGVTRFWVQFSWFGISWGSGVGVWKGGINATYADRGSVGVQ